MQENRSFDHYFGTLKGVRGFGDRATIQLAGGNSVFNQPNGSGRQYPWQLQRRPPAWSATTARRSRSATASLDHSWSTQHAAWNNGKMDNWISAKGNDRHHRLPGPRRHPVPLRAGRRVHDLRRLPLLDPDGDRPEPHLPVERHDRPGRQAGGPAYDGGDESGLTWQTYAEALQNAGVSWRVYQNAQRQLRRQRAGLLQAVHQRAKPGTPLHDRGMGSVPATTGSHAGRHRGRDQGRRARRHAAAGVLGGRQPGLLRAPVRPAGRRRALRQPGPPGPGRGPGDVFNSTVLFLNYDENDGFFDHVPPPVAAGRHGRTSS